MKDLQILLEAEKRSHEVTRMKHEDLNSSYKALG